ncbi:vesicular integral-membrane protein VIP36-like isoform X2 [Lineus longissimus]|uniref:vesicular integral-membrane protein VIP36-like isoform X2 n=1 Tax=Lineus longissimus TaxID=88925 RepID=UPI002B4E7271
MASFGNFSILCVLFISNFRVILGEWNTRDYMKREHSLIKPYQGSGLNIPLWDFSGSTMVTNSFVRLTPDRQSKQGGLWNSMPCHVRDWELHVHFKVWGQGTDLFGDGMAIWYSKERMNLGPVFGNKNGFTGLGIFLDTYSNHNGPHNHGHPYISAMVSNGSLHYDHDRDGTHTELAGCESQIRNKDHDTLIAIRYTGNTLTVSTDIDGKAAWKKCFETKGVHLPTGFYFGASAATGQLADNHDIISMKLYELTVDHAADDKTDYSKIEPSAEFFASPRDHVVDPKGGFMSGSMSGWKLLVIIIVGIIGLGICAMVGFIIYTNRQEHQRKRFY